jgi:hypothetical protein
MIEYSFEIIWGLLLWVSITGFMLLGYFKDIPLIMIVAFITGLGNIVLCLGIENFAPFTMIFALGNSVLFFIGMVRWKH